MRGTLTAFVAFLLSACGPPPVYDLVLVGGTVIDGTGQDRYRGDVGIVGDRIVAVTRGDIERAGAASVVDVTGKIVAPGFIDIHSHLDPLLRLPEAESKLRQGVTTTVGGPDGSSPWPIGEYLDSAALLGVGVNVAMLVGHNTIRGWVMGTEDRAPSSAELAEMQGMVGQAMAEGAWGLSTGLRYVPGAFSDVDEVVALAQIAGESGGVYTSHLREEGLDLLAGVAEAIEIGRRADLPIILTHHKAVGQPMWGSSERTLAMVDSANAAGRTIRIDQYPYAATYTGIDILVPPWARAGGDAAFFERLDDPMLRDSIVDGIVFNLVNDRGGNDLSRVQFALVNWMPELEGQTLRDWAEMRGLPPTMETGAQLVIDAIRRGGARAIYHVLDEADIQAIMRHPLTAIASDGRLVQPGEGQPHPRWYGTFPRVLGEYVREKGVISLEEAVRKMTTLPADHMRMGGRGVLAEGMIADVVVFDAGTVADRSTFQDPHQYPAGIDFVIVNGVLAVADGVFSDVRAGRILLR